MSVTAELRLKFQARQVGANDFGGPTFEPVLEKVLRFANGVAADQFDVLWTDEITLAPGASITLDLAGGGLTDAFGAAINAVELVGALVVAAAGNTNDVVVGAATAPVVIMGGTSPTFPVKPGGWLAFAAPGAAGQAPVVGGSADGIKFTNGAGGTSVTFKVALLLRSA